MCSACLKSPGVVENERTKLEVAEALGWLRADERACGKEWKLTRWNERQQQQPCNILRHARYV